MSRSLRMLALIAPLIAVGGCGDDSTDPVVGLDAFIGTYAIDPTVQVNCTIGDFGSAQLSVDTIEVTDASDDSLYLRVPFRVTTSVLGEIDTDADAQFAVAVTGDGGFAGSSPLAVSIPLGPTFVNGEGLVAIGGEFADEDAFSAEVTASFNTWIGSGEETPCTPVALDVSGTRVD